MDLRIIAVGKMKDRNLRAAVEDYARRIKRYAPLELIEVKAGSEAEESERILKHRKSGDLLVALDEHGRRIDSAGFARILERWMNEGRKGAAFVIGGADGLPDPVREKAALLLSLSPMTLPHQLARVVLAEQLYRAWTMLRGEPYPR